MKYYLGIDGGGTETKAVVTDETGKISAKAQGKTINFYSVGLETARENLKDIIKKLNSEIGVECFGGAFIGCSALDKKADEKTIDELCGGIINAEKIGMNSDIFIALKAMGEEKEKIVVICGTGSMAIGEDINGNTYISGGWGHILGDEGSAYSIALSALKGCAVLRDKEETSNILLNALRYFKISDYREIIDVVYSAECSKDIIAGFGEVIGNLAAEGDFAAKEIIEAEAKKLSKTVAIVLKKLGNIKQIGLYGGVFQNNLLFKDVFSEEIKKEYSNISFCVLDTPPEVIAAEIGRSL